MSYENRPIQAFEIPVEIMIMFLIKNREELTAIDVRNAISHKYKIDLRFDRVKQILNTFAARGNLKKEIKPGKKNKLTAHYSFLKLE